MNKTSKNKRQKVKKGHPWHRHHKVTLRKPPMRIFDLETVRIYEHFEGGA